MIIHYMEQREELEIFGYKLPAPPVKQGNVI